mgnify:CR=1 FL=1
MDDFTLLIDLHKGQKRQGPGGDEQTRKTIARAGLDASTPLAIADIGCGTGASTLLLAQSLNAEITAVDLFPEFLEVLHQKAKHQGLDQQISTLQCSMEDLPFSDDAFDVIWSEGAVYIMGFENGVNAWKRFLKPGGLLIVSEITWTGNDRPAELEEYWQAQYPEIDTMEAKIDSIRRAGYALIDSFFLPQSSWLENYYEPIEQSFPDFLRRNGSSGDAQAIVNAEEEEIALYRKYSTHYRYGMYLATRQR